MKDSAGSINDSGNLATMSEEDNEGKVDMSIAASSKQRNPSRRCKVDTTGIYSENNVRDDGVLVGEEDFANSRGQPKRGKRKRGKTKSGKPKSDDNDEYVDANDDSGDEVVPRAMKKRKTAAKKKKGIPSNDKENVPPQKTVAFSTAMIKPVSHCIAPSILYLNFAHSIILTFSIRLLFQDAHEYGSSSYKIDENGERRTCDIVGCSCPSHQAFWHKDENSLIAAVVVCSSHYRTFHGSLSPEKQKETDLLRESMKSELSKKLGSNLWTGKRLSDAIQGLCLNPRLGFMRVIPAKRGGGFVCGDWSELTRIIGTKKQKRANRKDTSAEQTLYNVLTNKYDFKPHPSMTRPKKAGAKFAPRILPGALEKPVILFHKDFTQTSVPGFSQKYLANERAAARKRRQRSKSNEEDSDDEEN